MRGTKSPTCHLLIMVVLGFIVLFSIAEMASKDGATYVKDIFGNTELVFPKYICIFAASYVVGVLICAIFQLIHAGLSRVWKWLVGCVEKCKVRKKPKCEREIKNKMFKKLTKKCNKSKRELEKLHKNGGGSNTKKKKIKARTKSLTKKIGEIEGELKKLRSENEWLKTTIKIDEQKNVIEEVDKKVNELKMWMEMQGEGMSGGRNGIEKKITEHKPTKN